MGPSSVLEAVFQAASDLVGFPVDQVSFKTKRYIYFLCPTPVKTLLEVPSINTEANVLA